MMDIIAKAGFVQSFLAFLLGIAFMITLYKLHFENRKNNKGDKGVVNRENVKSAVCAVHDVMQNDIHEIKQTLSKHGEQISSIDKNLGILTAEVTTQEKAIIELSFNMKNSNETNRLLLEELQLMNKKRIRRN